MEQKELTFAKKALCEPNGQPSSRRINGSKFVLICQILAYTVGVFFLLSGFGIIKLGTDSLPIFQNITNTVIAIFAMSMFSGWVYSGLASADKWKGISNDTPGVSSLFSNQTITASNKVTKQDDLSKTETKEEITQTNNQNG